MKDCSLWDMLSLELKPHMVISVVGAGGKTTLIYRLAQELYTMGKKVLITTSTHMYKPDICQGIISEDINDIKAELVGKDRPYISYAASACKDKKISGWDKNNMGILKELCDVLLIEADGARCMPIKVPAEHEPVIIDETDVVIGCAGLDALGKKISDVCFRSEEACRLLNVSSQHVITPADMAFILTCTEGTEKSVENRTYRIVLNKSDMAEADMALKVLSLMDVQYRDKTIITQLKT